MFRPFVMQGDKLLVKSEPFQTNFHEKSHHSLPYLTSLYQTKSRVECFELNSRCGFLRNFIWRCYLSAEMYFVHLHLTNA